MGASSGAKPDGMLVVLLGPDGAGKSTVIEMLLKRITPDQRWVTTGHWAPRLLRRTRDSGPVRRPHAAPPRDWLVSIVKLGYLWLDFTVGYLVRIRIPLMRSGLVIFDRYFLDLLVDPRRYRYGGPMWLARLIWRSLPKPDLVILLDVPEEIVQRRVTEVPLEETRRQRREYRSLVESLPNGHMVDGARPLAAVVDEVAELIARAGRANPRGRR